MEATTRDQLHLSSVGYKVLNSENLCDGSLYSEAYSATVMESMFDGFQVELYKTETDIEYVFDGCKKTDYVVNLSDSCEMTRMAVEVKRLLDFNGHNMLNEEYTASVLQNANEKAGQSNSGVVDADRWDCQVLHLLTCDEKVVDFVNGWFSTHDSNFTAVFVTVLSGNYCLLY